MAATLTIDVENVYQRTGVVLYRPDPQRYPLRPGPGFSSEVYGVLIEWPKAIGGQSLGWLQLRGRFEEGGVSRPLGDQEIHLREVGGRHNVQATGLFRRAIDPQRRKAFAFLAGSANLRGNVRLTLAVNTSSEGFIAHARKALAENSGATAGLVAEASATFFHLTPGSTEPETDDLVIRFVLRPGGPAVRDPDFVALDLGNTASALAVLPATRSGSADVQMLGTATLDPDPGGFLAEVGVLAQTPQAVLSEVRIDRVRSFAEDFPTGPPEVRQFPKREPGGDRARPPLLAPSRDLTRPGAVEWKIGTVARAGSPASLVLGAKRLAGTRDLHATVRVTATHRYVGPSGTIESVQGIELDARTPLELLAGRLLEHLVERTRRWPARVALTYPTTYTRHELQQLRRAVQRGWLRMLGAPLAPGDGAEPQDRDLALLVPAVQRLVTAPLDLEAQEEDPLIALSLDEASAAGFFFIYRRIFEEMGGGLVGFSYLYPDGLNLLLYDCGGGTTDVCLLNARVRDDLQALRVRVLARGGVRDFGGDDITREVCRLLKARLGVAVARALNKPVPAGPAAALEPGPDLARDLNRFIEAVAAADPNDEWVPTRDLRGAPSDERRQRALALWRWGEVLKAELRLQPEVALPALDRDTDELTQALFANVPQAQVLRGELARVRVRRAEIDALILDRARRSVEVCNQMIDRVFREGDRWGEVHWVVASGNAVRYPFLQELLRRELHVAELEPAAGGGDADGAAPDPDEGRTRFTFDDENAKAAVAKGAVLALATQEAGNIRLEFDWDLAARLPYDVAYEELSVNQMITLYREQTHYRELKAMKPQPVPMAAVAGPNQRAGAPGPRQFKLLRRFPGDARFGDFLLFEFPDGIRGGLTVRYADDSPYEFEVVDAAGRRGEPRDLTAADVYRAPAQRGDL